MPADAMTAEEIATMRRDAATWPTFFRIQSSVVVRLLDEFEALRAATAWIPCAERMPERGCRLLGYDQFYRRTGECYFEPPRRIVFIDSDDCDITHWMPLPPPPKETP